MGAIPCPHPHTEILCVAKATERKGVRVSDVLLVWSTLTLVMVVVAACSITIFVFRPEGVYVPVVIK